MKLLNSKQRAKLRSLAQTQPAILQVGKSGMGEALIKQVSDALTARELVKLSVHETAPYLPEEAASLLAQATLSEVVQVIGRKLTLYRRNPKKPVIEL